MIQLFYVKYKQITLWYQSLFFGFKGALGNYFNLIKSYRNHLNGSITCSGENGVFPRSPQRHQANLEKPTLQHED